MKFLRTIFVFTFATVAIFFVSNFIFGGVVLAADTSISSFTINGLNNNVKFNPQNKDKVLIDINMSNTVKVTRVYICTLDQICNGTKPNYTRYFSPSATTSSVSESWDGKVSTASDAAYAPEGEYRVMVSFYEDGAKTATNLFGQYTIYSDFSLAANSSTPDPEDKPSGGTPTPVVTSSTTVVYSVHYIQEDLSDYEEPTVFEVGAGRGRLSYLNSPVSFEAKHKVSKNLSAKNCDYIWNFGDGVSLIGEKVEHIYKYAGDYNVVLNGTCGDLKSVARTAVKVATANISISGKPDGAVEIANQGKYEINLYNWKLQSGKTAFTFPQDTIISAGKSVTFAPEYLKLTDLNNGIVLVDASNKNVVQINTNNLSLSATQEISVEDFQKFILAYQNTPTRQPITLLASTAPNPSSSDEGKGTTTPTFIPMTAAVADVIINEEENNIGFWSKIFHPIRTIKETFYE